MVKENSAIADLWRVAESNDIRTLERVLSTGVDVNACNEHGTTALMRAVSRGRLRMVEALIAKGADPNAIRNDNFTPLTLAAFFGHVDIVRLLVQAGAETNRVTRYGTSARMWASARTFQSVAKYLDKVPPTSPVHMGGSVEPERPLEHVQEPESNVYLIRNDVLHTLDEEVSFEHADDIPRTESPDLPDVVLDVPKDLLPQPILSARLRSATMGVGLGAFIVLISLAAISILSWTKARTDKRTIQAVRNTVQPGAESEQPVANVALTTPSDSHKRVHEEPVVKKVDKQPQTPQHIVNNSLRKEKTRVAADIKNEEIPEVKPAQQANDTFPVESDQAPATKGIRSPLSTQLVSSPSKNPVKPKVIQWP